MSEERMLRLGNTPLVQLEDIYAKLEANNPTGSIKDRPAFYILEHAEQTNALRPGMRIVEASSGNMGISLAFFGRENGYGVTIVMPSNMSDERKDAIRSYGAELILCDPGDFAGAIEIRDELAAQEGYFSTDQFQNPLNEDAHYALTGQEIIADAGSWPIDAFVAGVGTGGTVMGVGRALREVYGECYIAAVEAAESAVMSGLEPGCHGIQGISDGRVKTLAMKEMGVKHSGIDAVIAISTEAAMEEARRLERLYGHEGICVGLSSGANFLAAKQLRDRGYSAATVFPDGCGKYHSLGLTHHGLPRRRPLQQ